MKKLLLILLSATATIPMRANQSSTPATQAETPSNVGAILTTDPLTQQLREEYASYFELVKNNPLIKVNYPNVSYLLINEAYPTLFNMIKDLAKKMNIPIPVLCVYKTKAQDNNASACQVNIEDAGRIEIGETLINHPTLALTYNELRAVLAHELAHLKHKHSLKKLSWREHAELTGEIAVLIVLFTRSRYFSKRKFPLEGYVSAGTSVGFVVSFIRNLFWLKFSRDKEKEADITSVKTNKDGTSLISALTKLQKMSSMEKEEVKTEETNLDKILNLFSTHPSTPTRKKYLETDLPALTA